MMTTKELQDTIEHYTKWPDNEQIRDSARFYNKPEPDNGQCNNLRQLMCKRVIEASNKGMTPFHIDTDGYKVFIDKDPGVIWKILKRKEDSFND